MNKSKRLSKHLTLFAISALMVAPFSVRTIFAQDMPLPDESTIETTPSNDDMVQPSPSSSSNTHGPLVPITSDKFVMTPIDFGKTVRAYSYSLANVDNNEVDGSTIHDDQTTNSMLSISGTRIPFNTYLIVNDEGTLTQEGASEEKYNVYYDQTTNTLTLNGLTIDAPLNQPALHYSEESELPLTIELVSENTFKDDQTTTSNGLIILNTDLIIQGEGKLTVQSLLSTGDGIETNADLTINSGEVKLSVMGETTYGITANNLTINGGKLDILKPTIGIKANSISVNGGTTTIQSVNTGIYGPTTIQDGKISIESSEKSIDGNVTIAPHDDKAIDYVPDNGIIHASTVLPWEPITLQLEDTRFLAESYDLEMINVGGLVLDLEQLTLQVGSTHKLHVIIEPQEATDKRIDWTSSDETIATVSDDGIVTAMAAGEATITVTSKDGQHSASCSVTVYDPTSITQHPQSTTVNEGETVTFSVEASGTDLSYQWQQKSNGGDEWLNIKGETTNSYTFIASTQMDGNQYRCQITDLAGETANSEPAQLTVNALYTITVQVNGNGSASANSTSAIAGSPITLTATPDDGYYFSHWNVTSGDITIKENQFVMPASDVTLMAIFDPIVATPTPSLTPTPTAKPDDHKDDPTPTPGPTDDGGPFTRNECGDVFDRWGNLIWEAPNCDVPTPTPTPPPSTYRPSTTSSTKPTATPTPTPTQPIEPSETPMATATVNPTPTATETPQKQNETSFMTIFIFALGGIGLVALAVIGFIILRNRSER